MRHRMLLTVLAGLAAFFTWASLPTPGGTETLSGFGLRESAARIPLPRRRADGLRPSRPGTEKLVVIDRVTQQPLARVEVTGLIAGDQEVRFGATDEAGLIELPHQVRDVRLKIPDELGGLTFARTVEVGGGTLELPVYSRLELTIEVSGRVAVNGRLRLSALPDVSDRVTPGSHLHDVLIASRADITSYRRTLRRNGLLDDDLQIERVLDVVADAPCRVHVPHGGRVGLELLCAEGADEWDPAPLVTVARLVRGRTTTLFLAPRRRPVVAGIVLDENGDPVAGARVTVAARARFSQDDLVPRFVGEPAGPAHVLAARRGDREPTSIAKLTRRSDAQGRFAIPMPYTGHVAAWTFREGYGPAYDEIRLADRHASTRAMVLRLAPRRAAPTVVDLVDPDGEPIVGASVRMAAVDPPHPFQLEYPSRTSGPGGRLDLSHLERGRRYVFIVERDGHTTVTRSVLTGRPVTVTAPLR